MVKALCIMGSPRKMGNTELLIDELGEGLKSLNISFEKVSIANMNISPCMACEGCYKSVGCVIDDDMQSLYRKFDEADLIIVATPVYFGNVSAFIKIVLDRFQAILAAKASVKEGIYSEELINSKKKRYGFMLASAAREDYSMWSPINDVCKMMFGLLNAEKLGELIVPGTYDKLVTDMPGVLEEAYSKGVELAKKLSNN